MKAHGPKYSFSVSSFIHILWQARVTSKSDIRTWNKASGSGKLFSIDLMDESGEIRATAFKDQCDQYYDYIQVWSELVYPLKVFAVDRYLGLTSCGFTSLAHPWLSRGKDAFLLIWRSWGPFLPLGNCERLCICFHLMFPDMIWTGSIPLQSNDLIVE